MICPYKKSIHVVDITEEDSDRTIHTVHEDYIYETCLQQECGVWNEGKCKYRSDINEDNKQ